ncbi:hypothetical protein D3C81_1989030 [compost metagenome]
MLLQEFLRIGGDVLAAKGSRGGYDQMPGDLVIAGRQCAFRVFQLAQHLAAVFKVY